MVWTGGWDCGSLPPRLRESVGDGRGCRLSKPASLGKEALPSASHLHEGQAGQTEGGLRLQEAGRAWGATVPLGQRQ